MGTILAIPVMTLGLIRVGHGAVNTVQRWSADRARRAVTDSLLKHHDARATLGNRDGKSTLIEFVDYECPVCRAADSLLQIAFRKNPQLRVVVLQFPLVTIHPRAHAAAKAAVCAADQERFAQFHTTLFQHGVAPDERGLWRSARLAGVPDSVRFISCMGQQTTDLKVERAIALARRLGVRGTPTFLTQNGMRVGLEHVIELTAQRPLP